MSPKHRSKGDGGLYQRKDGMWVGVVELPQADGTRRRKVVYSKDRNQAIAKLKKLRRDVDEGRIAVTGNTTVEKWLQRWIEEIHGPRIRPTTKRDYQTSIDRHIVPAIGSKRLDKLTPAHIRSMHTRIGARRSAEKAHVILQKALKDAIREQMLTQNVAELLDKPRYKKTKRTSLSVELAKRIITTAFASRDEAEGTRWAAAFLTGGRQGELLGLRWEYVDLDAGVMDLSWQLQQLTQTHGCGEPVDGKYPCGRTRPGWCPQRRWDLPVDFEWEPCHRSLVFTRPKSEAGERFVHIVPPLLHHLRRLPRDNALVWHHDDGRPISPRDDQRAWKQLLDDAGVDHVSLHSARHTAATLLRASGADEQTRMEILGHATVDSQRIYAHPTQLRHAEAMNHAFAELL